MQAPLSPLDALLHLLPSITLGSPSPEHFDQVVFLPGPASSPWCSEDSLSCGSDVQLGV